MKEGKENVKVELELTKFVSNSGKNLVIDEENLAKTLEFAIAREEEILKHKCERMDVIHDFENIEGKTAKEIASIKYFSEFHIEYSGNPSMNGGNFYYNKYDPERNDEHLYHDADPLSGKGYQYRILSGMACSNYYRWFGYGIQQLGYKFVEENEETAKKFIKYIKEYSLIPLTTKTVGHTSGFDTEERELDQTLGAGLFWYCLRSDYLEGAKEFMEYVDKEYIDRAIKSLLKDIEDHSSESYKNYYDEWVKDRTNRELNMIHLLNKGKDLDDCKEVLEIIAESWLNSKMKFINKKTLKINK